MYGFTRPQAAACGRFSVAASLALALVLLGGAGRAAGAEVESPDVANVSGPVVTLVVGQVEVRAHDGAAWEAITAGTALRGGDTIRTASRAKAEVTHPAGVIRLFEHTLLRLPVETSGALQVVRRPELLVGRALFDVMPERLGGLVATVGVRLQSLFEVATPHIVSGVKGTRFAVIEQGSRSVVFVYAGVVATTNETGSPRDTALLTIGKLAMYENGRLTGVSAARLQDDWSAWTRPAVHKPRAPEGATRGSGPTRESRLEGATGEAAPAVLAESVTIEAAVVGTPTTDTGTSTPDTGSTTPGTSTPTAPPTLTTPSTTLPAPVSINPSNGKVQ